MTLNDTLLLLHHLLHFAKDDCGPFSLLNSVHFIIFFFIKYVSVRMQVFKCKRAFFTTFKVGINRVFIQLNNQLSPFLLSSCPAAHSQYIKYAA